MKSVISVCTTALVIGCLTAPIVYAGTLNTQSNTGVTIGLIDSAKTYVDVSLGVKTNSYIVDALVKKKEQGLAVHVLLSPKEKASSSQRILLLNLVNHGVSLKVSPKNNLSTYIVCGNSFVLTGSFNQESVGSPYNNSDLSATFGFNNVKRFDQVFSSVWAKSSQY